MPIKKIFFILIPLLVSCSDIKSSKYRDTRNLEIPPEMEITEQPKTKVQVQATDDLIDKGLGNIVSLSGSAEQPLIKIKKTFDRSWNIVEQALKLSEINITDKNREGGIFYINFDPDAQKSGESELFSNLSFFFFEDEYEQAAYKLTVKWRESDTEVTAELVELIEHGNMELLEDDEDKEDFAGSVDAGAKLINKLYKTIRDDLPLD